jgi:hypothetical protein
MHDCIERKIESKNAIEKNTFLFIPKMNFVEFFCLQFFMEEVFVALKLEKYI